MTVTFREIEWVDQPVVNVSMPKRPADNWRVWQADGQWVTFTKGTLLLIPLLPLLLPDEVVTAGARLVAVGFEAARRCPPNVTELQVFYMPGAVEVVSPEGTVSWQCRYGLAVRT